jgi:hypothetical protein
MLSTTEEPECRRRQRVIQRGEGGAVDGSDAAYPTTTVLPVAAAGEAAKAMAHTTIHPTVTGAVDGANSIAVN